MGYGPYILLRRNITGQVMFDGIDARLAEESIDRRVGGWRIIASAWALVLALLVVLAGTGVVECLRNASQHDPCSGPGLRSAPGADGCEIIPPNPDIFTWSNYGRAESGDCGGAGCRGWRLASTAASWAAI